MFFWGLGESDSWKVKELSRDFSSCLVVDIEFGIRV